MSRYKEFEQAVFEWMMEKHRKNQDFTFSVRQQANKGAEGDYFIGTERSNYFATTFWYIPVAYPGNASELISVIFKLPDEGFSYNFQFLQTKKPFNDQNKNGLKLLTELKPIIKDTFSNFYEGKIGSKMESYGFNSPKIIYSSINEMLEDFDSQLEKIFTIVNSKIEDIQIENRDFVAHRYTNQEFDNMLEKLEKRRNKYLNPDGKTVSVKDEKTLPTDGKKGDVNKQPLNQILFGPPGTGKTFSTINKALSIIKGINEDDLKDEYPSRQELKEEFDKLLIKDWENPVGQIGFVTFHQSISYEDFIEGIKPSVHDKKVSYEITSGIFKNISALAKDNWLDSEKSDEEILSFEDAFNKLKNEWEENPDLKFPLKTEGYDYTILGFTKSSISFKKASGGTAHTLSIATLSDYFYNVRVIQNSGVGIYYPSLSDKLKSYKPENKIKKIEKPFVLIIDEINRGNIAQIFGELITLIEKDKRFGAEEALEAVLPYSNETFTVPRNLYIIGTMNTADRSVEALDTALRRRFVFEEMMPKADLLHPKSIICRFWNKKEHWELDWEEWDLEPFKSKKEKLYNLFGINPAFEDEFKELEIEDSFVEAHFDSIDDAEFTGIRLDILLETINKRIEKLLGRDNLIGHSYFLKVLSIKDLMECFKNEIIPLLQEYFYGDYGKMCLVLGKGFIDIDQKKTEIESNFFADCEYDSDSFSEKKIWKLNPITDEGEFREAINTLLNNKI